MEDESEQYEVSEQGTSCHCVNIFTNTVYVIAVMPTYICAYVFEYLLWVSPFGGSVTHCHQSVHLSVCHV